VACGTVGVEDLLSGIDITAGKGGSGNTESDGASDSGTTSNLKRVRVSAGEMKS